MEQRDDPETGKKKTGDAQTKEKKEAQKTDRVSGSRDIDIMHS